jgi:hypothetical protein
MMKIAPVFLLVCLYVIQASSQVLTYDNRSYQAHIKTVQCYNTSKEQSLPVIALKSNERLVFSFDDLQAGSKNYWYAVEHCTSDWKSSRLSTVDYLESLNEDRITEYKYSSGTIQKYTHYQLTLPNTQIRPKISGNYLLKVYEDGDQKKLVITQRFYVVENLATIGIDVVPSQQVGLRFSNQKINFTIAHQMPIQNPYQDVKAIVMQNNNPLTAIVNTKPSFIKPGTLTYNDLNSNDFAAGNEFRKFDIRSLRYKGENVQDILKDSIVNVVLFTDINTNKAKYSNLLDENGNFFIRNQEGRDDATESDYAGITFTLNAVPPSANGEVYVVGRFNNYLLSEANRLSYDVSRKRFYGNLYVKQGLFDYKYVWLDKLTGKTDLTVFEGSYFESENTYQVLAYYKKPGARWEELIGYSSISNTKR